MRYDKWREFVTTGINTINARGLKAGGGGKLLPVIGAVFLLASGLRAYADTPTFGRDVAPIIYSQCASCHRAGEVAPFALTSYEDVRKRARQIAQITAQRVMPPWQPEPGYGAFRHERRLTDAQIKTLAQWAAQGAPQGSQAEQPPSPYMNGWQLGKPDMILTMPKAYTIPAEGKDVNRSFPLHIHLPADKYIRAAEFHPGNRRIVHHATLMLDKSGKAMQLEAQQSGAGSGYVSFGGPGFLPAGGLPGYAPGMPPEVFPTDASGVLPKDIDVVFGMHYHPTGKPETDQSCIGLYFTDKPPVRIGSLVVMGVLNLDIAPGERAHLEQDTYTLPVDVDVEALYEHMHLLGKTCKLWAELPDHSTRPIIKINDWDFNWQNTYHVKDRIHLPRGTVLHGEWTHDNTADNIHQFSRPPRQVTNGESSTDEMAGVLINVYVNNDLDNGILWLTNLGHLAAASARPPAHAKTARLHVGASLLESGYNGATGLLVGLLQKPGTILVEGLAGFCALLVLPSVFALLFPRATTQAAENLRSAPLRAFGRGLLPTFLLLPALGMLFAASEAAQLLGLLLFAVMGALALVGAGGWSRLLSARLRRKSGKPETARTLLAGGLLYCFACLVPFLGWFLLAPLSLIAGAGAAWKTIRLPRRVAAPRVSVAAQTA